jgi:hypothetical protein
MPTIDRTAAGHKLYIPDGEILRQFLAARNEVDIVRGPVGSGSSSASCVRIWAHAIEQTPYSGVRYSRWAIVRNTFPALRDTTLKTWKFWYEEELYGPVAMSRPFTHHIVLPAGIDMRGNEVPGVDLEVLFVALDDEKDIAKLRSLELTGAFVNELEFLDKPIFDEIQSRCGRYPPISMGGPSWYGVIGDMNAPAEDHWVPMLLGDVPLPEEFTEQERMEWRKPEKWGYHIQPPGMIEIRDAEGTVIDYRINPKAENLKWLPEDYYARLIKGKSKTWIDSRILNKITIYTEGDAVWPTFNPDVHVARQNLVPNANYPVYVGLDFGRNPYACFGQMISGRLFIQNEIVGRNEGASRFAPKVKRMLEVEYAGCPAIHLWGDPKGKDRGQSDEKTAYDVFRSFGLRVEAVRFVGQVNDILVRIEAVDHILGRAIDGRPALLISPKCRQLKMACAGAYHWTETGDGKKAPEKDKYADAADGLQYLILGSGEGRRLVHLPEAAALVPRPMYAGRRVGRRGQ